MEVTEQLTGRRGRHDGENRGQVQHIAGVNPIPGERPVGVQQREGDTKGDEEAGLPFDKTPREEDHHTDDRAEFDGVTEPLATDPGTIAGAEGRAR